MKCLYILNRTGVKSNSETTQDKKNLTRNDSLIIGKSFKTSDTHNC